jgi:phage gpG-like protein
VLAVPVTTRVIDTPALNQMLRGRDGVVVRTLLARALRVETGAKRRVKADTGRLRQSITHEIVQTAQGPTARVGTNVKYSLAVHNGTGIYGPSAQRIRPQHAGVLRFTRGGQVYFRASVRGQRPNPFLKDAIEQEL